MISVIVFSIFMGCLIFTIVYRDVIKIKMFEKTTLKNSSKIDDKGEFETIYNQIINDNRIDEVEKEQQKNFKKSFWEISLSILNILLSLMMIIIFLKVEHENDNLLRILLFVSFLLFIFLNFVISFLKLKEYSKYKDIIIRKLISTIDCNIIYDPNPRNNIAVKELYFEACYKDNSVDRFELTDYMEYKLDGDITVKLADLHLRHKVKKGETRKVFEGIAVKIIGNNNIPNFVFSPKNKILEGKERIKYNNQNFEEVFDLYAEDINSVEMSVTENIKQELSKLYEEYGIVFEISIRNNNIYIRFFTGCLFENKNLSRNVLNKKRLYREYVIFKSILNMISRIDEIFSEH